MIKLKNCYHCEECENPIGNLGDKWEIVYILNEKKLCEKCWNKLSEFDD